MPGKGGRNAIERPLAKGVSAVQACRLLWVAARTASGHEPLVTIRLGLVT